MSASAPTATVPFREYSSYVRARFVNDHLKAEIDMRAFGLLAEVPERGSKGLPAFLQAEGHHRRVAVASRCLRGAVEFVGHHDA
jgi:hypothetical protein